MHTGPSGPVKMFGDALLLSNYHIADHIDKHLFVILVIIVNFIIVVIIYHEPLLNSGDALCSLVVNVG